MRYQTLGRTNLNVSIAGLGCGGASRLGMRNGKSVEHAASLVRLAVENGINLIDTARSYGTEPAVGLALKDLNRDELILSTKGNFRRHGLLGKLSPYSTAELEKQLHQSLKTLGVETIDIYHIHGLSNDLIDPLINKMLPVLERAKQQGKIRHLAASERFSKDHRHKAMPALLERTDAFDVLMLGFNPLNPTARKRILPQTIERDIGVQVMYAVRKAMSDPQHLKQAVMQLIELGQIDADEVDTDDPLGFLIDEETPTLTDAAYRFAAHEPGCHSVMFGTGNPDHLLANIASLNKGPLPEAKLTRLAKIFGNADAVTGG